MRRPLGYNRYGNKVTFSREPESWLRGRGSSTTATPYTHIRQFVSNSVVSTSAFLAGCSSGMTCIRSDGTWGSCKPIYGLGLPLIINVLILARKLVSYWWSARRAKERSNKYIRPPRMCRMELKRRANYVSCFGEDGQGGLLALASQMQNDGLLLGCPLRLTTKQVKYWLRVV